MKARGCVRGVEHEFGFCWWVWLVALVVSGCSSSNSDNAASSSAVATSATAAEPSTPAAPAPAGPKPASVSAALPFGCSCGGIRTTCGTPLNPCTKAICVYDDPQDPTCQHCGIGQLCDADNNQCTIDACTSGICNTTTRPQPASDGTACVSSTGLPGRCFSQVCCTGCIDRNGVCHDISAEDARLCGAGGVACFGCFDNNICTVDACTRGTCDFSAPSNTTIACRPAADECDLPDFCQGTQCDPTDAKQKPGTACKDDGNVCTADACDGQSNACQHPAGNKGVECKPKNGECDVAEQCDGASTQCPIDAFAAKGTACTADSLPCTLEICDGNGACTHPAGNSGKVCRTSIGECDPQETCDGSSTACPANGFLPAGTACTDDGVICTTDKCNASGACAHVAGNKGVECKAASGVCDLAETCDGVSVACPANVTKPDGTSCANANVCDGSEVCKGGTCTAGTPLSCDDKNDCTVDLACDSATGCQHTAKADGTACNDNDACNGTSDTCQGGKCVGTGQGCDDGNDCTTDTCSSGTCSHSSKGDGTACSDNNACTKGDQCVSGKCQSGAALNCDDGNPCTTDPACDTQLGCVPKPVQDGTSCADTDKCDGEEKCQGGVCQRGTPLSCADTDPCTTDSCDPATGCKFTAASNGSSCSDGKACNGAETCQAGVCQPGLGLNCDDKNPCTVDSCDDATGGCKHVNVGDGTACGDQEICNGIEQCVKGACVAGPPPDCDDNNPCTTESCQEGKGCVYKAATDGTACTDNSACTKNDKCQAGKCAPGPAVNCDDHNDCTDDRCNPLKGCINENKADATACDDKNPCSTKSECRAGVCATVSGLDCDDDNPCTVDACDTGSSTCTHSFEANGTPCRDRDACSIEDKCTNGVCAKGLDLDCSDTNPCTQEECDPTKGCTSKILNGTPCSDGNACTPQDQCTTGLCTPLIDNPCKAKNECQQDGACDLITGACIDKPKDNGTPCTGGGQCQAGSCVGGSDGGAGAGGAGGTAGDSGTAATGGAGGAGGTAGQPGSGGVGGNLDSGLDGGSEEVFRRNPGGCSCELPGRSRNLLGAKDALLGLAVLATARRYRRSLRRARGRAER